MSDGYLQQIWDRLYYSATTTLANLAAGAGAVRFIVLGAGVLAAIGIAMWLISKLHFGRRRRM